MEATTKAQPESVLIETLWNVKNCPSTSTPSIACINRNIVECKACKQLSRYCAVLRINRNIVECKGMKKAGYKVGIYCVLIETLWNVK